MRYSFIAVAIAATAVLSACSTSQETSYEGSETATTTSTFTEQAAPAISPAEELRERVAEGDLREAARQLDLSVVAMDRDTMWDFYTQRCKAEVGGREEWDLVVDFVFAAVDGINEEPQPIDWIASVDGTSGQVITVDANSNGPYYSLEPRPWTFIDGKWQYDNC
ncbi:hypothetical protein [Rhodococcus sp. NPDC049939]|uniref:hypothetical protein n=1 Tax=Rhodococcus sp. NPDC049939 TaxID=3155511 RepID=UPI0033EE66EF